MIDFKHPFIDQTFHFPYLSSTMSRAEELLETLKVNGNFLITAESQNHGIGRKANFWYSPPGGLWFTLGIYGFDLRSNFSLFCGLKLIESLCETYLLAENRIKIKWPNDILINEKKAAGIIVRYFPRFNTYLIGIGLNSNFCDFPPELEVSATSLCLEFNLIIANEKLLAGFLDKLSDDFPKYLEEFKLDLDVYCKYDFLKNRNISINTEFAGFQGKYLGVSMDGALLLRLRNGKIQPFYAGSVNLLK